MGYTQKSIYSFSSEGRGQKARANIRLTLQSIFCVMKKATFAVGLVQIAEFQQKINRSHSTPHLDQPGSHVTVYVKVNLKPCSYELAYVYLTSTEVSSRSIVGTKPAKLQHVLSSEAGSWLQGTFYTLIIQVQCPIYKFIYPESEPVLLLETRQNDNHSPGPLPTTLSFIFS